MTWIRLILGAFTAMLAATLLHAAPAYPERVGQREFIADIAGLIDETDELSIRELCDRLLTDHAIPIVVVTIPSLADMKARGWRIERYAHNLFDEWGIGGPDNNTGVLLLVSKGDRQVRIEFGAGWSRTKDSLAATVINSVVVPQFKAGRFSTGILLAVDALANGLTSAPPPSTSSRPTESTNAPASTSSSSASPPSDSRLPPSQNDDLALIPARNAATKSFTKTVFSGLAVGLCAAVGFGALIFFLISILGGVARRTAGEGAAFNEYGPHAWRGSSGGGGFWPGFFAGQWMSSHHHHHRTPTPPRPPSHSGGGFFGGGGGGGFSGGSFGGGFSGGGGSTGSW